METSLVIQKEHDYRPAYLRELISPYQPRSLQSSNQLLLTIPRTNLTIGRCVFSYSSHDLERHSTIL